jgi:hypothetical protein
MSQTPPTPPSVVEPGSETCSKVDTDGCRCTAPPVVRGRCGTHALQVRRNGSWPTADIEFIDGCRRIARIHGEEAALRSKETFRLAYLRLTKLYGYRKARPSINVWPLLLQYEADVLRNK